MRLEELVTQGCLAWTDSIVYDEAASTLTIHFSRDPLTLMVYGVLRFTGMSEYQEYRHFPDSEDREEVEAGLLTENLIGIEEQPMSATTQYYIVTDTQEISFCTPDAPVWTATTQSEAS